MRTLQAPNSARFKHLVDELFVQKKSLAQEQAFFTDPPDSHSVRKVCVCVMISCLRGSLMSLWLIFNYLYLLTQS